MLVLSSTGVVLQSSVSQRVNHALASQIPYQCVLAPYYPGTTPLLRAKNGREMANSRGAFNILEVEELHLIV
jgi:hypothetical protein